MIADKETVSDQEFISTDRGKKLFFDFNSKLHKVMVEFVDRNEEVWNEDPRFLDGIISASFFSNGIYIMNVPNREEVKRLIGILVDEYFDKTGRSGQ